MECPTNRGECPTKQLKCPTNPVKCPTNRRVSASLNPRMQVGDIIAAPLRAYKTTKNEKQRVQELMELIGLKPDYYHRLPHEFSGGQRQRIGIACALEPKLSICDESVSALDVSVQAQVINLPSPANPPTGCVFHTRCPIAQDICKQKTPPLETKGNNGEHVVSCFFPVEHELNELHEKHYSKS